MLVAVGACGSGTGTGLVVPGDGVLDCEDGQVVRGVGISVSAESEQAAVAEALGQWTSQSAVAVAFPQNELWSASREGRDVAIAVPEVDGSGLWVVHDVQTCGAPDEGAAAIDGELDCASETRWSVQGSIDPSVPGLATGGEAVRTALAQYVQNHGGEVRLVGDQIGSLVVEQRERVIAIAIEVAAGGWAVSTVVGCDGFN